MAIIKKKIEDLKPGKEYLLTVRAKNADLNVISDYSDSIRFTVPTDATIPGGIDDLILAANFEKVLITFSDISDKDIRRYEYEIYDNEALTGTPITGFADATIFTVSVQNSTDSVEKTYWARVRAIDTSGNVGEWSNVANSSATPLIGDQYIDSLTASKITAGTIGAHTITLDGINSILKSSNYSAGSTGWQIKGDGSAEFDNAIIRGAIEGGTIDIGGNDSTSFHVDIDGNMWIGSDIYASSPFRVSSSGQFDIGGDDSTSMHIDNAGNIWIGESIANRNTAPFVIENTGAMHVGGQDASSLHIQSNGNLISGAPSSNTRTSAYAVTAVASSTPSAGFVRYTLSTNHGWSIGEVVSIYGISPSASVMYAKVNATIVDVPASNRFVIASTASGAYSSGTLVARRAAPFSLDTVSVLGSNPGSVRTSDVEISGFISGVGIDRNISNVLRIIDSVALGSSTLYFTADDTSYDVGVNFKLSAGEGFIARLNTTNMITINSSGISALLPIVGSEIRSYNNGSAGSPAYKFAATNDGFYTDGFNPYWANNGTGYAIYTQANDGDGSGLNADLLDGLHASSFVQTSGTQTVGGNKTFSNTIYFSSNIDITGNLYNASVPSYTSSYASWSGSVGGTIGYRASSSYRYKEDVSDINLEILNPYKLLQIPIKQFKYKDGYLGSGDQKIGMILPGLMAEDVDQYYPAAGVLNSDQMPESWDPFFIIPPMLSLIQELFKKIDDLESRIGN